MRPEVVRSQIVEAQTILAPVANLLGDDDRLTPIMDGLESTPVRVAVVGTFNAGKSTLVNALIGDNLMPTMPTPANATIAELSRASAERFELERSGSVQSLSRAQFQAEVTRAASPNEPLAVARAHLTNSSLPLGLVLADTPGVGSAEEMHADVTYGYLPQVDAVLLVIDANAGGLQASQVTFIRDRILQRVRDRIWIVINKLNQVPADSHRQILDEFRRNLEDRAGLVAARMFVVDAKSAADARTQGGSVLGTGLDELETALRTEVYEKLRQVRADRGLRQLTAALDDAAAQVRSRAAALSFDSAHLDAALEAVRSDQDAARERISSARDALEHDKRSFLREVERRVTDVIATVAGNAPSYVRQARESASQSAASGEFLLANAIRADLTRALERMTREWLEPELRARISTIGKELQSAVADTSLSIHVDPIDGVRVGPNPLITGLVEIGLVVLLDGLLPGGFLVALLTRGVGNDSFKPVVGQIAGWVEKLIQGQVLAGLANQIRDQISRCAPTTAAEVVAQVDLVYRKAVDAVEKELRRGLASYERALADAHAQRAKGEQAANDEKMRLLSVVRDIEALSSKLRNA